MEGHHCLEMVVRFAEERGHSMSFAVELAAFVAAELVIVELAAALQRVSYGKSRCLHWQLEVLVAVAAGFVEEAIELVEYYPTRC